VYEKKPKDNGGFETEHQGRVEAISPQHAETSDAELPRNAWGNVLTRDVTSQTLFRK
jgi:hypothetical protein